jgi:hypothetical protein
LRTAAESLSEVLEFRASRRLHVVSFLTNEEARRVLDREVSATMALAPYAGETACLVVVQSPAADLQNADPIRMTGTPVHEIAHQFVAKKTGATKRLGDGNRSMRVSAWLNEGLAELVRYAFLKDAARMDGALREFQNASDRLTWREIGRLLDDLADQRRAKVFGRATGAVAELARKVEVPRPFDRLLDIDRSVPSDAVCAVPSLEDARRLLFS